MNELVQKDFWFDKGKFQEILSSIKNINWAFAYSLVIGN